MNKIGLDDVKIMSEIIAFKTIWMYGNKRSYISGLFLRNFEGTDLHPNCFAHVLAKGQNKFPHFRMYLGNICLLHPVEHHNWDAGTEEQRINYALDFAENTKGTVDWDKLKKLDGDLKKLYKKHFPATKHGIIGYKYDEQEVYEIVSELNALFMTELMSNRA